MQWLYNLIILRGRGHQGLSALSRGLLYGGSSRCWIMCSYATAKCCIERAAVGRLVAHVRCCQGTPPSVPPGGCPHELLANHSQQTLSDRPLVGELVMCGGGGGGRGGGEDMALLVVL